MKKKNYNYITCYRKKDGYIYIYLKNGEKYRCKLINAIARGRYYLSLLGICNDRLFAMLSIDKDKLTSKLPGKYYSGDWPESKTEEEVFDLLRALIKESKIRYYANTEI